jgi:hypothetical protein
MGDAMVDYLGRVADPGSESGQSADPMRQSTVVPSNVVNRIVAPSIANRTDGDQPSPE